MIDVGIAERGLMEAYEIANQMHHAYLKIEDEIEQLTYIFSHSPELFSSRDLMICRRNYLALQHFMDDLMSELAGRDASS